MKTKIALFQFPDSSIDKLYRHTTDVCRQWGGGETPTPPFADSLALTGRETSNGLPSVGHRLMICCGWLTL